MLLTRQHQSEVAQVEGPGQAVGHVHLPPLADVGHLHLCWTLHTNHRNSRKDVRTPHLCSDLPDTSWKVSGKGKGDPCTQAALSYVGQIFFYI